MSVKHKVLLTGKNKELINELFKTETETLELFTTTLNKTDLTNHLASLKPDLLVYFLQKESMEDIQTLSDVRSSLQGAHTKLALVGTIDETLKVNGMMSSKAEYTIHTTEGKEEVFAKIFEIEHEYMPVSEEEKKHILVIDDDPIMLKLIKEQLHEMYTVATTISGKIALKFLETKYTDLILLDYEMPEMNGPQVLNSLRERKKTENIPVVFLTGTKDKEKVQNALMMKPQGYLLKPIDKDKLLEMIQSLIG